MKKILFIALGAILLGSTQASAKFITNPLEGIAMQTTYTYYKVVRNGASPLNATHANKINDVLHVYGSYAVLTTSACRTWWLNEPVVLGETTKWSYYFMSSGTITSTSLMFALNCSIDS